MDLFYGYFCAHWSAKWVKQSQKGDRSKNKGEGDFRLGF